MIYTEEFETALKVCIDGSITPIRATSPEYIELRLAVDGNIGILKPKNLPYPYCMVVDEDALLLKSKMPNMVGCHLHGFAEIMGDIVIMRKNEECVGINISQLIGIECEHIGVLTAWLKEISAKYEATSKLLATLAAS